MVFLAVAFSAVLAGAIQNIAGFGAGIILMLVLPHFFDMLASSSINVSICVGMTVILAWKFRKYVSPRSILLPLISFSAVNIFTIWIVGSLDLHYLAMAFGLFFIALAFYFAFFQSRIHITATPVTAISCGALGGALSGLFSIGAPAMALYFLAVTKDRKSYMGNLQLLLAVSNIISMCTRIYRGIYTLDLIPVTVAGFAGLLVGQYIGSRISGRLDPIKLNRMIYFLVGFSGLTTFLKQLF